ncbi:MAG: ammonium transporter [Leptospiraceae bacterium]|nr:ammonium transporter [Leptospiraceae bacterium]
MHDHRLIDQLWILTASALVLFMQAGFLCVESGLTRTKNSINVAIKNVTDFGVATILFWLFGFGLMFGISYHGVAGTSGFFQTLNGNGGWISSFFIFQLMFCGTASTIVSGAVAERMSFTAYLLSTTIISVLIYPISGHWAWGGMLANTGKGWLAAQGFVDFAGSTVVHSVGGWVSLAALLHIGARIGRFSTDGVVQKMNPSNLPLAMLGGIILWFGWLGFNGGSTLALNEAVGPIIAKTLLAGAAGMLTALLLGWIKDGYAEATQPLNGSLAGLVSITAGCHAVNEWQAVVIGLGGGLLIMPTEKLLEKLRIDDAVGAIPVHLAGGIWGTLAVGIFGAPEKLATGLGRFEQIGIQALGILCIAAFAFTVAFFLLWFVGKFHSLRVSAEDERTGLNISEHRARTDLLDLFFVMDHQKQTGDLTYDVPVEPFTEVGQIAERYNEVLRKIRSTLADNDRAKSDLVEAYKKVQEEQARAEQLLLNVLPEKVATQLKENPDIIANSFPEVTVLFADIVDFTRLAHKFRPEIIVGILNRIFSTFDELAEKYGLEKIKTIGDAYMVVGGLPNPLKNHAEAVANFALESMAQLKRFKLKTGDELTMRIGINTGPVVAGVIGKKKFIYDIWGDAVNLASRMESNSMPGVIQLTEQTALKLGKNFIVEPRGDVDVKGRGLIKAFFLKGKTA